MHDQAVLPWPLLPAEVWVAMVAYSIYLLSGPWLLYTALSGYPLAMVSSRSALPPSLHWMYLPVTFRIETRRSMLH